MIEFSLSGGSNVQRELVRITKVLFGTEIQKVFLAGARVVAAAARHRAPKRSGLLKKAISANGVSPRMVATRGPAAFAKANIKRGRVKAPHAHLVEGGTKVAAGVFFFRDAVNASGGAVLSKATSETQKLVEGVLR